jgi:hypothetical protein
VCVVKLIPGDPLKNVGIPYSYGNQADSMELESLPLHPGSPITMRRKEISKHYALAPLGGLSAHALLGMGVMAWLALTLALTTST